MPSRAPVVPHQPRGKELAFAKRKSQNEKTGSSDCEYESGSESDSGSFTFLPTESSSSRSSRKLTKKKHKKRRSSSGDDDSDQEPSRTPLSETIHVHRQVQRLNSHPNMAKTRKRATQEKDEENATEKENAELKLKLARIMKRQKLDRTATSGAAAASGTSKAMTREVGKVTKTKLWKVCKFFKNDNKVLKGAKFVMENMELTEMAGLKGTELAEAEEIWKSNYASTIRTNLNRQRNYVQQELREVMEEVFKNNKEAEYPNVEQMLDIIVRDKLDDKTPDAERELHETIFDNYWNVLIPKVTGHSRWGPNKRHHGLLSFHKEDPNDKEAPPYVSESDEAFLAVLWINCYEKWEYKALCERNKEDIEKDHSKMETPFTDAKGGQKRFGGWNAEGINKFDDLKATIEKNRKKQKKYVEDVEEAALERIRKAEKVEEQEAQRKTKKKSARGSSAIIEEDETDDEDDYGAW